MGAVSDRTQAAKWRQWAREEREAGFTSVAETLELYASEAEQRSEVARLREAKQIERWQRWEGSKQ